MSPEDIKNAVAPALGKHLAPSILKDLLVYQETDSDDEPILRFQVIVDNHGPSLSADQIFFAAGVVRNALATINETRFPLLTFPSSDELPEVAA